MGTKSSTGASIECNDEISYNNKTYIFKRKPFE